MVAVVEVEVAGVDVVDIEVAVDDGAVVVEAVVGGAVVVVTVDSTVVATSKVVVCARNWTPSSAVTNVGSDPPLLNTATAVTVAMAANARRRDAPRFIVAAKHQSETGSATHQQMRAH